MEKEQEQTTSSNELTETEPLVPTSDESLALTVPAYKKYKLLGLSLYGLVFMLTIGYVGYFMKESPVASVNGVDISRVDYEKNVKLFEASATAQGADVTDETLKQEIRKQALDMLVNTALLKSSAEALGLVASPEEVKRLFALFTDQMNTNAELKKSVTDLGITDEKMRANIAERLVIDQFIESQTDVKNITVTDEEITALFDELSQNVSVQEGEGGTLPLTAPTPKMAVLH